MAWQNQISLLQMYISACISRFALYVWRLYLLISKNLESNSICIGLILVRCSIHTRYIWIYSKLNICMNPPCWIICICMYICMCISNCSSVRGGPPKCITPDISRTLHNTAHGGILIQYMFSCNVHSCICIENIAVSPLCYIYISAWLDHVIYG